MTFRSMILVTLVLLCIAAVASAQEHPTAMNPSTMKLVTFPVMPTCARGAVVNGDPEKGASIIYAKMDAGCVFPWHWHTPSEHIMQVSGTTRLQAKGEKPTTIHAGGFALMPSHHVHEATCLTACTLYVYSDAAFDMHYVDAAGKEISPAEAIKAVKEKLPPAQTR